MKAYKVFFIFLLFMFSPMSVDAASLSVSSASTSYEVGDTFQVNVYVSSTDQSMNAASGVVSFPKDKLQAVSISKAGSIFSLWAEEPTFSNGSGSADFEGIILNPGFTGSRGKILSINFKAIDSGQANLSFASGAVLANDGTGTNILNGMGALSLKLDIPAPKLDNLPETTSDEDEIVEPETIDEVIVPTPVPSFFPPTSIVEVAPSENFLQKVNNLFKDIIKTSELLILFATLLFLLAGFVVHKLSNRQTKKVRRRSKIEKDIHFTFELLRDDLLEQLSLLQKAKSKRDLTKEEENLAKIIESHLGAAEKFVKKSLDSNE